jgi:hypothetical protein
VTVSSAVASNRIVYLSSTKSTSAANINGTVTSIPSTTNKSGFIVKFNENGDFDNWYTHIDCTSNPTDNSSTSRVIQVNSSNEIAMSCNLGGLESGTGSDETFIIYINGTPQTETTKKIKNVCGALFKYTSGGSFAWVVRHGIFVGGNSSTFEEFVFDSSGNIIIAGSKQEVQSAVYDRYGNSGGKIPGSQIGPTGVIIKINSDGTYSNNYGYIDTDRYDGTQIVAVDKYDNIIFGGDTPGFTNSGNTNIMNIYDKYGYVTVTNSFDYYSSYGFLLKFNANFTCNKISL